MRRVLSALALVCATTLALAVAFVAVPAASAAMPDDPGPSCPIDPETGGCLPDRDRDGRGDTVDNCPDHYNPGQEDNDGDSVGNACDPTPNGDPPPPPDGGGGGGGGGGGSTSCSAPVVLHEHYYFGGRCWNFWPGTHAYVGDAANDQASSIRVAAGYVATLFVHSSYGGSSYNATETTDTPHGWTNVGNDTVSSLVVQANQPDPAFRDGEVWSDADYVFYATPTRGCARALDVVKYRHQISGRVHWTYSFGISFCWNGAVVTHAWSPIVDKAIAPLPFPANLIQWWQYQALSLQVGSTGYRSLIARADGAFEFCGVKYLCVRRVEPYIRIELRGDGSATCWTSSRTTAHRCLRTSA